MSNTTNLFEETVLDIGKKVHISFLANHVSKKPYKYLQKERPVLNNKSFEEILYKEKTKERNEKKSDMGY